MPKILVSKTPFTSESAANAYLMEDGLVNFSKIATLSDRIEKAMKGQEDAKTTAVFVAPRRAKPVQFSATKQRSGDHKYLLSRAVKVVSRKRITPEAYARVKVLLKCYDPASLTKALADGQKLAQAALKSHMGKMNKVTVKVKKEKGKIRDAEGKVFDESLDLVYEILQQGGLPVGSITETKGMFGSQMLVKLDEGHVISIGKSDISKFRAAKKAEKAE